MRENIAVVGCLRLLPGVEKICPVKCYSTGHFFFRIKKKKHLVQALINADVYVCAQQIM